MTSPDPIWLPRELAEATSAVGEFTSFVSGRTGRRFLDYGDLWRWSVEDLNGFWTAIWDYFHVMADGEASVALADSVMPGATWFPGTRLNYAEHALRWGVDDQLAITSIAESGSTSRLTWGELRSDVASLAHWMRRAGVRRGDRVVGYLPNSTPSVIAFLATASVGAVWASCAQDYAAAGAAARFAQLDPVVLFAADGYSWNGRTYDRRDEVRALESALPTLRITVRIPFSSHAGDGPAGWDDRTAEAGARTTSHVNWQEALSERALADYDRVDFNAPLWVLFSSGTTGSPKGIVHGHGGVVLEHLKLLALHFDVGPDRPFFWYTTTNWMMWNVQVSGLLVGAPIVLYDGSPAFSSPDRLWDIAAQTRVDLLGVSPGYLLASAKADVNPAGKFDLSALRTLGVTGSPLPSHSYYWVRDRVGVSVQLTSSSGGTDVATAFAGSTPTTPVWPGEISAPMLGVALESWDAGGQPIHDGVGELVITKPMPSMPVRFWNDDDGQRYCEAYFSTFPGVWRHGDWVRITDRGSLIISGRSDSTLNRNGIRLGSAEIYSAVDDLRQIGESLVIGAELPDGGYWLVLFVVMADGETLDLATADEIRKAISMRASPRHVPDDVIAVPAIPHTRTGKKLEIPVKRLIQGQDVRTVVSRDAVDDYDALIFFSSFRGGPTSRHSWTSLRFQSQQG